MPLGVTDCSTYRFMENMLIVSELNI
jgi:hypothetical protein